MKHYKRFTDNSTIRHLSPLEHGIFAMLMDAYFAHERGFTKNEAFRLTRAKSAAETRALMAVLGELFILENGIYRNTQADTQLTWARQKSAMSREAVKVREARKQASGSVHFLRPKKPEGMIQ